jgi:NADPH-dependent glutamate synthase beta subunit-like oxidoreductase
MTLHRQLALARELRAAAPGLPVVGSGFSWLRQFVPNVAAAALREGMMDFAGLGRAALANPALPAQISANGGVAPESACMVCFACSQLNAEGEPVGCVLRDAETYGPIYRQMRRFDSDQLMAGAARCHLCEAAPCIAASPTRTNIPTFIQAYRNGDEARAYEIIRERDPLPELTSRFSPRWLESERACIETALTGTPVPILDLQYAIAWSARERGATGVRMPALPPEPSSAQPAESLHRQSGIGPSYLPIAIIGAGPTGLAATIRLLEFGHSIHLYEQSHRLGGVPTRLLAPQRAMPDPQTEINAILAPALTAGQLQIHSGVTLGKGLSLAALASQGCGAILIATGLWEEPTLGVVPGVMGALTFLESPDERVPDRVAILAGGDGAMDAARAAQARGAREIYIIFGGPRSALHWHLPESWFATPGVRSMMQWQPLGYITGSDGRASAVRLRQTELNTEATLPVDLVIEAMTLQPSAQVQAAIAAYEAVPAGGAGKNSRPRLYTAGALVNGGTSVGHCVAEGLAAAETIHRDLCPSP